MAQYGEVLNDYQPEKEAIYQGFTQFYNNPTMYKIKDVEQFSQYMSKTYCLLNQECRYLIALVYRDANSLGTPVELRTLNWYSFQTRSMPDKHNLPPHSYQARRGGILDTPIRRTKVTPDDSTYSCKDLPVVVTMLHTKKGPSAYNDTGSLIQALEQYQTIITFSE